MENVAELRKKVEMEIRSIVSGGSTPLFGLDVMNHYHLGFSDREGHILEGSKGKYLRPVFCLTICGGLGGDLDEALPAAASLELVHRTSLIFDDIQDVGRERNGQPTMWTVWGANQAINAGLALSCLARLAAQRGQQRGLSPEKTLGILNVLENAVVELCWGQYFDLSFMETVNVTDEDYLRMVRGKTSALFGASCEVGALVADANKPNREAAKNLGVNLGIAFQIHDDYLGIWGDEAEVGKTANDLAEKKRSLPVVLALKHETGKMKRWLELPEITPDIAGAIKTWMEHQGVPAEVKSMERHFTRQAKINLTELSLSRETADQFGEVLSSLEERKI